jgi:hypothetical protein
MRERAPGGGVKTALQGDKAMYVEKETEKAFLMNMDAVPFWIQKRWLVRKDGALGLTRAGWKAYHIAARKHWKHFGYDAEKEFGLLRETEKAVLLAGLVERPGGSGGPDGYGETVEFWIPKSMTGNWEFVSGKIREIEAGFPFKGMRVARRYTHMNRAAPEGSGGF